MVGIVSGLTYSYFTDKAVLGTNTYATGVLEIRFNGQETLPGFTFTGGPGDYVTQVFTLSNYGAPHFAGPSTLSAKELLAKSVRKSGNLALYNALDAKLYANAGWGGCTNNGTNPFVPGKGCTVYDGSLSALLNADVLDATQWGVHPSLVPGNSFTMTFEVGLPETGLDQTSLMGKQAVFDLEIDGYTEEL